ncbi:MAG: ribosome assembly cofactor RimP [Treponema sp.]|nr:ribosome assembly cofactor RimP [Treponema sp.]
MRYKSKDVVESENDEITSLRQPLEVILKGLGFSLIELVISRHRGSVQVKVVIYSGKPIGTNDCVKVHRSILPRLELFFGNQDIHLEVSSPGIDRLIKTGEEFAHYKSRGVRCYCTDISDWKAGILESISENGIIIKTNDGIETDIKFDVIAKAKLDPSQEV